MFQAKGCQFNIKHIQLVVFLNKIYAFMQIVKIYKMH